MAKYRYKLTWEHVTLFGSARYYDSAGRPVTSPAQVPEEAWHMAVRETNDLTEMLAQYRGLMKLWKDGVEYVRNVRAWQITMPEWREMDEGELGSVPPSPSADPSRAR